MFFFKRLLRYGTIIQVSQRFENVDHTGFCPVKGSMVDGDGYGYQLSLVCRYDYKVTNTRTGFGLLKLFKAIFF